MLIYKIPFSFKIVKRVASSSFLNVSFLFWTVGLTRKDITLGFRKVLITTLLLSTDQIISQLLKETVDS